MIYFRLFQVTVLTLVLFCGASVEITKNPERKPKWRGRPEPRGVGRKKPREEVEVTLPTPL